jgi:hypothetical protein
VPDLYAAPRADVSFGDIFSAEFLFDVHLRADAVQMGMQDIPPKRGGGSAYSDRFTGRRAFVLGHGAPHRAVLITDNCVVDTALGQDRGGAGPRGRLLFAPITAASDADLKTQTFGRFVLPQEGQMSAGIAERRCFMVDARDVAAHKDAREASLADEFADELEVDWNAFAARRGPRVAVRNADKMVDVLVNRRGAEEPTAIEMQAGHEVAEVIAQVWSLEGVQLEGFAGLQDGAAGDAALDALQEALRRLGDQTARAVELLDQSRAAGAET